MPSPAWSSTIVNAVPACACPTRCCSTSRPRSSVAGAAADAVAGALRDVLADRVVRVDHPTAVRAAIDELAAGGDPLRAYALARG